MTHSETARQFVHVLIGAGSLLLRWLTWWQAAAIAATAVAFNVAVLPRLAPALFRQGDPEARWRSGIVLYPLAVLALIVSFPAHPEIAGSAWAILAAGDGAATLVGTRVPVRPLGWNVRKSVGGLVAFVLCGGAAGIGVAWWLSIDHAHAARWWIIAAPAAAAIVAGLVETLAITLDDNISVPAIAALVLWTLSLIDVRIWLDSWEIASPNATNAIAVNTVAALAGWAARTVTPGGAVAGWAIGVAVYLGSGSRGWWLLVASFALAVAATRAGRRRKDQAAIAESRRGRRGPGNALANTGVGAWMACLSLGIARGDLASLAMVASLVTAASDTVASEIGKAWGTRTWSLTSRARVAPGASGGMSIAGTVSGAAAAAALATMAAWLGLVAYTTIPAVVVAATVASIAEGVLGATLEPPGILDNDSLNFINSLLGAALAVALVW